MTISGFTSLYQEPIQALSRAGTFLSGTTLSALSTQSHTAKGMHPFVLGAFGCLALSYFAIGYLFYYSCSQEEQEETRKTSQCALLLSNKFHRDALF
jgi:hypothetical protein